MNANTSSRVKPRVLITGGSGLLGLNWALTIRDSFDVILGLNERIIALGGTTAERLDSSGRDNLFRQFDQISPDLIVHTAGLTSVELCEADPDRARKLNTDLAGIIAEYCGQRRKGLIHVSTDHLFDGTQSMPSETGAVCPLNIYGRTKADAEEAVLRACPEALVVRTNFFGWGPSYRRSFSDWIIDSLSVGKEIGVFQDVFFTPILASELAEGAMELWSLGASGLIHLAGQDRISKYDFAFRLASLLKLETGLLNPAELGNSKTLVRRPFDMSLCTKKARSLLVSRDFTLDSQLRKLAEQNSLGEPIF